VVSAPAQNLSADDLNNRLIHRRAVEAVIWGMPAVNTDLMYQAMLSLGGKPNQIVYWSGLLDWRNQTLTPNPDVIYLMAFFNTRTAPSLSRFRGRTTASSTAASWIPGRRRWRMSVRPASTRAWAASM
jgi:hypothetical protein